MGMPVDEQVERLVDSVRSMSADIRLKWKMKLAGLGVAGAGGLALWLGAASSRVRAAGIGTLVLGLLMMLGIGGIRFIFAQLAKDKQHTRT